MMLAQKLIQANKRSLNVLHLRFIIINTERNAMLSTLKEDQTLRLQVGLIRAISTCHELK